MVPFSTEWLADMTRFVCRLLTIEEIGPGIAPCKIGLQSGETLPNGRFIGVRSWPCISNV